MLKNDGPSTIAALAQRLELTGEAVRQQLLQMQREGWIESKLDRGMEPGRTGRPATRYRLTAAGDHLFPKRYDSLNVMVLDAIASELGPESVVRVLANVCEQRVAAVAPALEGLTLREKVDALKDLYVAHDPYMEAVETNGEFRLVERNCPFYNAAMQRPILCSVSTNALTRLLGYRVEREETFQRGNGRCVFRVRTDRPIDAQRWQFQPES